MSDIDALDIYDAEPSARDVADFRMYGNWLLQLVGRADSTYEHQPRHPRGRLAGEARPTVSETTPGAHGHGI
jgi:hypothetical protein